MTKSLSRSFAVLLLVITAIAVLAVVVVVVVIFIVSIDYRISTRFRLGHMPNVNGTIPGHACVTLR